MRKRISLLSLFLAMFLLTVCAANRKNDTPIAPSPPAAEQTVPVSEETGTAISTQALAEYETWFNQMDCNGLLRFPYTDGADPDQIEPFLEFLFYDMGETDITNEEYALLEKAGMFLEVDEFRLSRAFVADHLVTMLNMSPDAVNRMLDESENTLGIYLAETDAWYICHGDTAYMPYTFRRGEYFAASETVKLYYTNPFLTVITPDGEIEFLTDCPMAVTLLIEGGERRVLANEILS